MPTSLGYCCKCGSELHYNAEFDYADYDNVCTNPPHELAPQGEIMNEIDAVIERVEKLNSFIAAIDPMKVTRPIEDSEDDSHSLYNR